MRRLWSYRAAIGFAALVLCYFAATLALASTERRLHPAAALRAAPYDAQALAGAAYASLQVDQSPAALTRSAQMATQALAREPINVAALRTLGLIAAIRGDVIGAQARFAMVERLSRRDLATQLWWIEFEVARGSVPGALTYFDEALRTSPQSADILLPILASAVQEAPIATALAPFLASRPSYFRQFFIQASDTTPDIAQVSRIGRTLLNRLDPDDQDLINRIILRYGRDGKYDNAWRVFVWASGRQPENNVVNGDFDSPTPLRLFNWSPTENDALTAEISPRDGSNSLYLIARVSRGLATRQLVRLSAGRYQLSAIVGDVPDARIDRPTIGIACAKDDKPVLNQVSFPPTAAASGIRLTAQFDVTAGCAYQWLNLLASASSEDETRAWIDNIQIRPVQRR